MLTHAEDVEAEALCDGLADQLIRETVEADMASQGKVPLLFILAGRKRQISRAAVTYTVRDPGGSTKAKEEPPALLGHQRGTAQTPALPTAPCALPRFILSPLTATNKSKGREEHCS